MSAGKSWREVERLERRRAYVESLEMLTRAVQTRARRTGITARMTVSCVDTTPIVNRSCESGPIL